MPTNDVPPDIIDYYARSYDEDARLRQQVHGRLEFLRTQELLRRYLPPSPARVLDVGGGTGVHAEWLAADGHRVHLVDPVARHREQAAALGTFTVSDGDARALDAADHGYDVVLLLGPLYHLTRRADRLRALDEARRVVRPGGLVVTAAISRHAALLDLAVQGQVNPGNEARYAQGISDGAYDGSNGFTTAYFHTVAELRQEWADSGLGQPQVFGVEGPLWPTVRHLTASGLPVPAALFDSVLSAARIVERDPDLLAASSHLLAVNSPAPS
ncbi:bifunctional 2-polyprenyl-6-hydroxyphenol methylase/3-demethylubiquinol 3-O-methyltransferase UbiG [Streptacidiphilus sp. P02-A3a]|uniref:class I SAM-dependent methyltransferase n=1 Tax=Streptacidiphilus sp. P02-A3a TaxID=2704468 RepID=UPI0015FAF96B|nr:class I SAM-dependent methyltransferase [Streptacidiphilus sp. P02-A3a]QMU69720.1 methyltransferase domain-containing protein [Streptacidiphilus sp. P02-A3a]